jgi:hypothetical protein
MREEREKKKIRALLPFNCAAVERTAMAFLSLSFSPLLPDVLDPPQA